jgi:tripartite-type tricarboxylate transporter receptor subunit TctC
MTQLHLQRRQLLAAATLLACGSAWSQTSQPLRVLLPFSPGSGVDTIARSAQAALSAALGGQAVVFENIAGAGGVAGTQALVRAAPDGLTVGFISNNHAVNPSILRNLPYDSLNDITPISVVGGSHFLLVTHPEKLAARNAQELQAQLKARPGQHNMASAGNGTIIHLALEMLVEAMGVKAQHVPYRGTGPMLTDLIAGQVDFAVAAVPAVQGHLATGRLRAIGVMGQRRTASLPDLPTLAEQGFPSVDVAGWFALVGPRGLPPEQVSRLHRAVSSAFQDPQVKAAMTRQDNFIDPSTPEQAATFLRAEQERYARLVAQANIKID